MPADLEDIADSCARTLDLLRQFVDPAHSGDRDGAATLLAEIEIEAITHMGHHQRSLRRRLVALQDILNAGPDDAASR